MPVLVTALAEHNCNPEMDSDLICESNICRFVKRQAVYYMKTHALIKASASLYEQGFDLVAQILSSEDALTLCAEKKRFEKRIRSPVIFAKSFKETPKENSIYTASNNQIEIIFG
jgi:hypothetical protein